MSIYKQEKKHCRKAKYELDCILYKSMIVDSSYT